MKTYKINEIETEAVYEVVKKTQDYLMNYRKLLRVDQNKKRQDLIPLLESAIKTLKAIKHGNHH